MRTFDFFFQNSAASPIHIPKATSRQLLLPLVLVAQVKEVRSWLSPLLNLLTAKALALAHLPHPSDALAREPGERSRRADRHDAAAHLPSPAAGADGERERPQRRAPSSMSS